MNKRTDWIFLASLAAYAVLFWKEMPGLNFLIMNCILIAGLLLRDKTLLRNKAWLAAAGAALLTATCLFWHGYALCVFANFISLLLVSSFVVNSKNSWFGALGLAMLNTVASCAFIVIGAVNRLSAVSGNSGNHSRRWLKRSILVVCVLLVCTAFFAMYRGSSVLFASLTDKIDLSFISFGWCIFMAIGALLLFSFYKQQNFDPITSWDRNHAAELHPAERTGKLNALMSLDSEYFTGIVLFGILNVMLLLVNVLDITFLAGGTAFLPADVTYSEYVHQGINQLILSILFATMLILFWFRNYHTEGKQYRTLRWLAALWVLQNIVMIAITIHRNHSYIYVFGLTYKRIGVDAYLLLALTGLVIVLWKVLRQQSNAFVLHRFGWACFGVLVAATPVNWDQLIFRHNSSLRRMLDMSYINSLSDNTLVDQHLYALKGNAVTTDDMNRLHWRTFRFLSEQRALREGNHWPSTTIAGVTNRNTLMAMPRLKEDTVVSAAHLRLEHLYYFPCYAHVRTLNLYGNQLETVGELALYTKLESVDLRSNPLVSLGGIEKCQSLRYLDLRNTPVSDCSLLAKLPNLETLYIDFLTGEEQAYLHSFNPDLAINPN
jgi:hypothetical protein